MEAALQVEQVLLGKKKPFQAQAELKWIVEEAGNRSFDAGRPAPPPLTEEEKIAFRKYMQELDEEAGRFLDELNEK